MAKTQGPTVVAVAIVFAVLSFVTISLRLCGRILVAKTAGPDDALICVAVLLSWAFIGCNIASVRHGLGSHIEDVVARGTDNMITYGQIVWLSSIFYNACLGFIKASVLSLYMRLGDRKLTRAAMVIAVVIGCQAGGNVMACIFQCWPIKAAYDITILPADKKCVNINAFYLANAAVNIFTDLLTYTLPFPLIARLQAPRKQKIGLGVMLGLGLFACVSSIVRITYIPPMLSSDDATWVITGAMYWSVIETNIGILAASIPSFKALAARYAPRLLGSSNNTGSKLSGFKMMPRNQSGEDNDDVRDGLGPRKVDVRAGNQSGLEDNSSEEQLFAMSGRIGVKTTIVHEYEDTSLGEGMGRRGSDLESRA